MVNILKQVTVPIIGLLVGVGLFQSSALTQPTAPGGGTTPGPSLGGTTPSTPSSEKYKCPTGLSLTQLPPTGQKPPGSVPPTAIDGSAVPNTVTCAPATTPPTAPGATTPPTAPGGGRNPGPSLGGTTPGPSLGGTTPGPSLGGTTPPTAPSEKYKCPTGLSLTQLPPTGQKPPGAVAPTATDGSAVPNTVTCAPPQ